MAHTFTSLLVHALFSTKDREPLIRSEIKSELYAYMGGIVKSLPGKPVLINGTNDHIHLLFVLPATLALSDFMEKLKANSSKWAKERARGFPWQTGYAAFGVSQSKLAEVKSYILSQDDHHRKRSYREEVIALLKRHGIDCDSRFVV
jgi:putative transposase